MKLEIGRVNIKDIQFGDKTFVKDGVLTVDKTGLIASLKEDERIKDIQLDIAKPGEKVRIIPVKDVIEPRVKVSGTGEGFPGVTTKPSQCGEGRTNVLYNAAVVTVGDIVGFQEGVIDMWGEGAKWTPFSKTLNITVDIQVVEDLDTHTHEETVRLAGLRAAESPRQQFKKRGSDEGDGDEGMRGHETRVELESRGLRRSFGFVAGRGTYRRRSFAAVSATVDRLPQ